MVPRVVPFLTLLALAAAQNFPLVFRAPVDTCSCPAPSTNVVLTTVTNTQNATVTTTVPGTRTVGPAGTSIVTDVSGTSTTTTLTSSFSTTLTVTSTSTAYVTTTANVPNTATEYSYTTSYTATQTVTSTSVVGGSGTWTGGVPYRAVTTTYTTLTGTNIPETSTTHTTSTYTNTETTSTRTVTYASSTSVAKRAWNLLIGRDATSTVDGSVCYVRTGYVTVTAGTTTGPGSVPNYGNSTRTPPPYPFTSPSTVVCPGPRCSNSTTSSRGSASTTTSIVSYKPTTYSGGETTTLSDGSTTTFTSGHVTSVPVYTTRTVTDGDSTTSSTSTGPTPFSTNSYGVRIYREDQPQCDSIRQRSDTDIARMYCNTEVSGLVPISTGGASSFEDCINTGRAASASNSAVIGVRYDNSTTPARCTTYSAQFDSSGTGPVLSYRRNTYLSVYLPKADIYTPPQPSPSYTTSDEGSTGTSTGTSTSSGTSCGCSSTGAVTSRSTVYATTVSTLTTSATSYSTSTVPYPVVTETTTTTSTLTATASTTTTLRSTVYTGTVATSITTRVTNVMTTTSGITESGAATSTVGVTSAYGFGQCPGGAVYTASNGVVLQQQDCNTDYPGGDIRGYGTSMPNVYECARRCATVSGCQMAQYRGDQSYCYLKSSAATSSSSLANATAIRVLNPLVTTTVAPTNPAQVYTRVKTIYATYTTSFVAAAPSASACPGLDRTFLQTSGGQYGSGIVSWLIRCSGHVFGGTNLQVIKTTSITTCINMCAQTQSCSLVLLGGDGNCTLRAVNTATTDLQYVDGTSIVGMLAGKYYAAAPVLNNFSDPNSLNAPGVGPNSGWQIDTDGPYSYWQQNSNNTINGTYDLTSLTMHCNASEWYPESVTIYRNFQTCVGGSYIAALDWQIVNSSVYRTGGGATLTLFFDSTQVWTSGDLSGADYRPWQKSSSRQFLSQALWTTWKLVLTCPRNRDMAVNVDNLSGLMAYPPANEIGSTNTASTLAEREAWSAVEEPLLEAGSAAW